MRSGTLFMVSLCMSSLVLSWVMFKVIYHFYSLRYWLLLNQERCFVIEKKKTWFKIQSWLFEFIEFFYPLIESKLQHLAITITLVLNKYNSIRYSCSSFFNIVKIRPADFKLSCLILVTIYLMWGLLKGKVLDSSNDKHTNNLSRRSLELTGDGLWSVLCKNLRGPRNGLSYKSWLLLQ